MPQRRRKLPPCRLGQHRLDFLRRQLMLAQLFTDIRQCKSRGDGSGYQAVAASLEGLTQPQLGQPDLASRGMREAQPVQTSPDRLPALGTLAQLLMPAIS